MDNKKLKIVFNAEVSEYGEVVDSIADVLRAGAIIEDVLKDGFKFTEVFDLLKLSPIVNEIVEDFPVFISEFMKLDGPTAILAVNQAAKEVEGELDTVTSIALKILKRAAGTFAFAERTYEEAQAELEGWKALGQLIAPKSKASGSND